MDPTTTTTFMPHRVARTDITPDVYVSTINLALLPGYSASLVSSRPFQTQVRGGVHDELTHHSCTEAEALVVHHTVVAELREDIIDGGA